MRHEMAKKSRILIVDDKASMLKMLARLLGGAYEVETASSGREAVAAFEARPADLVLTDIRMPDMDGMEVLRVVKDRSPSTEVILMTAYATVAQAVDAVKAGAYYYLTKPFEPEELRLTLEKALERKDLREETRRLQEQVRREYGFANLIGESEPMKRACDLARRAAATDVTVLLTGDSGTGKELFARAIHAASDRRSRRFVAINCGAMPRDLIESELFGHARGAFSGAVKDKNGLFTEADGGTMLLDEIGELDPGLQIKINRVIQEHEIRRVGDTRDVPVDVRIIAATNSDLGAAMEGGRFREDLYYRLNVFPIQLPLLRERADDVPLLVEHFLERFAGDRVDEYTVTPAAMRLLMNYSWPGNVRELENALKRVVVLCEDGRITPDLFDFVEPGGGPPTLAVEGLGDMPYRDAMDRISEEGQRQYLTEMLLKCEGNVTRAAERAGIERESFHRLMRKCGVQAEEIRRRLAGAGDE